MMKFNMPETLKYLLEAAMEVFSPDTDNYPNIGIQPFSGEVHSEKYFD